jgi:hypothetical protein
VRCCPCMKMLGSQNSHHNRYIVMSAMIKAHGSAG